MTHWPKIVLPPVVLGLGIAGAWVLMATAPDVVAEPPAAVAPLVRVAVLAPQTLQMRVVSQGTVAARTESALVPQVSGTIVAVAPSFVSGGFFASGDVLLEIDPADYQVALERARAALARAESEEIRARKELERARGLARTGVASAAQLDDAERAHSVAVAGRREAGAMLQQAERDLTRTTVRAPFSGRVREERADLGQFVTRGVPIATVYATDHAEVRLPIPDQDLAFLDLPLGADAAAAGSGPAVVLRASFAGAQHEWRGRIVRTEGEIDPRSRMIHVVARVDDPYRSDGERPPLAIGLFVEAEVIGRVVHDVVVAPRGAMRDREHLLVVDTGDRLRWRRVEVIRYQGEEVVVAARSLRAGDRAVVTTLEAAVDGMRVRSVAEADDSPAAAHPPK